MGKEARLNPVAVANSVPQDRIDYLKIGEGYGLLGIGLQPVIDSEGVFHVFLMATCARVSELVPINKVAKIALGEAARIRCDDLIAKVAQALDGETTREIPPEVSLS
jgi:hypothetical protein